MHKYRMNAKFKPNVLEQKEKNLNLATKKKKKRIGVNN